MARTAKTTTKAAPAVTFRKGNPVKWKNDEGTILHGVVVSSRGDNLTVLPKGARSKTVTVAKASARMDLPKEVVEETPLKGEAPKASRKAAPKKAAPKTELVEVPAAKFEFNDTKKDTPAKAKAKSRVKANSEAPSVNIEPKVSAKVDAKTGNSVFTVTLNSLSSLKGDKGAIQLVKSLGDLAKALAETAAEIEKKLAR